MSADDHRDGGQNDGQHPDFEELQRIIQEMLSGGANPSGMDSEQLARAAGLSMNPAMMQQLFSTLRGAMQQPGEGIDWSTTRSTAISLAQDGGDSGDPAPAMRAFPVAALWLDEVTELGATPDAPRTLTRVEWIQQSVDTWISLAEPVAESITRALTESIQHQMPEEFSGALQGALPMLQRVGGALFAVQLGTVVGRLSGEVVSAGDIGIPLLSGPGREGGALLPSGVEAFAKGLEQDIDTVTLYLAIRELAHARLFRHAKWLQLHLRTAISDFTRGVRIDTDRIEELARDIDPSQPEQLQEIIAGGALIPPKTPAQEAAHLRLETMLALIEGWVDAVTAEAAQRIPGAEAIAEMVRRRRATGGPAEQAFAALAGLELRPRRLREAAALWRTVGERGGISTRDGLWAHPDLLPTAEELEHPARLLERIGLAGTEESEEDKSFDAELAALLDGTLPIGDETGEGPSKSETDVGETGEGESGSGDGSGAEDGGEGRDADPRP